MKQASHCLSYLKNLFLVTSLCAVTSCDKLEDVTKEVEGLVEKAKEMKGSLTGEETLPISEEELVKSDVAFGKALEILEKVPAILVKVRDGKTALEARKKIDLLTKEASVLIPDLAIIEPEEEGVPTPPHHLTDAPYYVLKENEADYTARRTKIAQRILFQVDRVKNVTINSPIEADVLINGLVGLSKGEVEGAGGPKGIAIDHRDSRAVPAGIFGSEEKSWLPSGVVMGNPGEKKIKKKPAERKKKPAEGKGK